MSKKNKIHNSTKKNKIHNFDVHVFRNTISCIRIVSSDFFPYILKVTKMSQYLITAVTMVTNCIMLTLLPIAMVTGD